MNGNLEDTTPAGVLQVLSSQHSTGAVRFLGSSGCTVYLHRGELYFAESDETAEDLAMALVRPNRLTAEQWDTATEQGYPFETVGEQLITKGGISREMLASVVLSVIYDPLIQLFRAPEGDYEFAPDVVHWIGPYRTFDVDAIVSEVRRRTREADEMAPVVPSLDAIVRSARSLPVNHGSVNLRRDDWEVVVAASTGCSVTDLAAELGRGRWSTARIVYRLANADLVMVSDGAPADAGSTDTFDADTFAGAPLATDAPTSEADTFDPEAFSSDTFGDDTFDGGSFGEGSLGAGTDTDDVAGAASPWESTISPSPEFGFDTADAPPPLDDAAFDSVDTDSEIEEGDPWSLADAPAPADDDPWGEFDRGTTDGDDAGIGEESADTWDPAALYGDTPEPAAADDGSGDDGSWGGGLTAVPDDRADLSDAPAAFDPGSEFGDTEPPALHPDIAKALAESTYADSATAINAMAARLGAIDADDDDDWESPSGIDEGSGDEFWSDGGSEADDFIWKPAVWDTGVESAPLPQRESVRASAGPEPSQPSDPAWLDNLYAEFMPGEGGGAPAAPTAAPDATQEADAAPKQRTLKRLISAIRRL